MKNYFFIALLYFIPAFSFATEKPSTADFTFRWLSQTGETHSHRLKGAIGNQIMVANTGHCEAVYDKDGNLVNDGVNDGSFNYFLAKTEPFEHFIHDNLVWVKLGNSKTDSSTPKERANALTKDLMDGALKTLHMKEQFMPGKTEFSSEHKLVANTLFATLQQSRTGKDGVNIDPDRLRVLLEQAVMKLADHKFDQGSYIKRAETFSKMDKNAICKNGLKATSTQ